MAHSIGHDQDAHQRHEYPISARDEDLGCGGVRRGYVGCVPAAALEHRSHLGGFELRLGDEANECAPHSEDAEVERRCFVEEGELATRALDHSCDDESQHRVKLDAPDNYASLLMT